MSTNVSVIPMLWWAAVFVISGAGGFIMWWIKRVAAKGEKTERDLLEYKTMVADKFATKDMLTTLKTEISAEFSDFRRFLREDIDRLVEVIRHKE